MEREGSVALFYFVRAWLGELTAIWLLTLAVIGSDQPGACYDGIARQIRAYSASGSSGIVVDSEYVFSTKHRSKMSHTHEEWTESNLNHYQR